MAKVRDLDLVLIPAHPGYHVVLLDLEDDVVPTEATTINDIAESLEPVIAWALEARVYEDPRLWRQRGPQSVGVRPITPGGVHTCDSGYWALLGPDGAYRVPYGPTYRSREAALAAWLDEQGSR